MYGNEVEKAGYLEFSKPKKVNGAFFWIEQFIDSCSLTSLILEKQISKWHLCYISSVSFSLKHCGWWTLVKQFPVSRGLKLCFSISPVPGDCLICRTWGKKISGNGDTFPLYVYPYKFPKLQKIFTSVWMLRKSFQISLISPGLCWIWRIVFLKNYVLIILQMGKTN